MKFYWTMPAPLKAYYRQELEKYKTELRHNNLHSAWHQLERAHILGQAWPREHTHVHLIMLRFGIRIKSIKEIAGQVPRLLVGGVKSFVGEIPTGNTGGASVPPLRPMEIPQDLREILNTYTS